MTSFTITESVVEKATLGWLEGLGWSVAHGPDITTDTLNAERTGYGQVVLEQHLRDALTRLNPDLPAAALDDTLRKLTRPEGTTLETRNRAFHWMLVDGVTVEYHEAAGTIRGAKLAIFILNQKIRPFTAKWHKISVEQGFGDPIGVQFRDELRDLQKVLRIYTAMLAEMAGIEDISELEG